MSNKKTRYIISGILLAYFGLKDMEQFNILYNGIAIAASITAFVLAYMEYKKEGSE